MARVDLVCTEAEKELWVTAAHDERVTLSEFLRRSADARAQQVRVLRDGVKAEGHSRQGDPVRQRADLGAEIEKPLHSPANPKASNGSTETEMPAKSPETVIETPVQAALRRSREAANG